MNYYIANEDYKLGCADSSKRPVDLSAITEACYVPELSPVLSAGGKAAVVGVHLVVTAATGSITTSIIDGVNVTFVSATGSIRGTSKRLRSQGKSVCLADDEINAENVGSYTGNGSKGKLTVTGSNVNTGATVTEICDIWFSDAGQTITKAV